MLRVFPYFRMLRKAGLLNILYESDHLKHFEKLRFVLLIYVVNTEETG